MGEKLYSLLASARALAMSRRGNVAMMFALAIIPVTIAAGVGLDFARGMMVRSAMSEALDAAALAVGSTTGLNHDSAQTLAQKYFDANYTGDASYGTPTVSIPSGAYTTTPGSVQLTASDTMPTTFLHVIGLNSIALN
ncbi:MAG TPA: TadE/TadG family type IV pilus assembly protein, partial [Rhizomicrobium sp.]